MKYLFHFFLTGPILQLRESGESTSARASPQPISIDNVNIEIAADDGRTSTPDPVFGLKLPGHDETAHNADIDLAEGAIFKN